ncbi:glycosyltransferase 87 family protein [Mycobacterium xenopi]|uniref:glycosyltransferase 87 family protein n=1 Tax=Mycobacterium xenopi TaxID=1789 RepID=UPI00115BE44B|nr:glycosyltransferase 87 family protein [Mycobacterium xenopi]MDA3660054.1 glycosyltransferase 87 family protein [Mycobacterium xenopi]
MSVWVRCGGPVVLAGALMLYALVYVHWPRLAVQVDLQVYRFGAMRVRDGLDLYSIGLTGNSKELLFIYPPFAALGFLPLALIAEVSAQALWLVLMCVLVFYVVWRMLASLRVTQPDGLWALTALLVGLVAWLEPFRLSLQLGQINIAILAIVVADLLTPAQRKWAGVGVGLAAGIKLTPALFIVYLAAVGRVRAALMAAATFLITVVIGFAFLPKDSEYYWLRRGFHDVGRISHDPFANTSVEGLLHRLHVPAMVGTGMSAALAAVAVALAVMAYRRGHAVLGLALVGMASAAASPFSWSHHWVWFAPLMVHLGYRACVVRSRYSALTLLLLCALLAGWFTSAPGGDIREASVLSLRPGGVWNAIIPGSYVLVFLAVLAYTAVWLWRSARVSQPGPDREPQLALQAS